MSNWLMLRGEWDKNNKQSFKDNTDMWWHLLQEIAGQNPYTIWYKDKKLSGEYDYIFARGGFDYYKPILKKFPNAYKIFYGAGKRIVPEEDLGYSLILCDTEAQKYKILKKYPNIRTELWIKPAAKHFKPVECGKEYDVCYVADCHSPFQEKIKRVKWVYKTLPEDMTMLHLGKCSIKPPPNVTVKKVSRLDMPEWYSKCRVGIVPYRGYDSCPRVIPEMLACGLHVYGLPSVNFWAEKYIYEDPDPYDDGDYLNGDIYEKQHFWGNVEYRMHHNSFLGKTEIDNIVKYYQKHLSLKPAAEHLRKIIYE